MRDVYVQNPALGDASSLDKQLEENAQKLDKLNQELQKFEVCCVLVLWYLFFPLMAYNRIPIINIILSSSLYY